MHQKTQQKKWQNSRLFCFLFFRILYSANQLYCYYSPKFKKIAHSPQQTHTNIDNSYEKNIVRHYFMLNMNERDETRKRNKFYQIEREIKFNKTTDSLKN